MRKLASVQKITNLEPIEGADAIEKATVLGWEVVVAKGEFKVGDLCVYCEIDSILPDQPEFEFLRSKKFRIKTIRLRGQISQGICFPLTILRMPNKPSIKEGLDVTKILGIKKWLPYQNKSQRQQSSKLRYPSWMPQSVVRYLHKFRFIRKYFLWRSADRTFPPEIPKTDETRVQVMQDLLDKYKGEECYITEKLDGSSITVYRINGKFGVCSRNVDLSRGDNNFWNTVIKHKLEEKFNEHFADNVNVAMQGELVGPGIQGNKYELEELDIYFFNLFDIKEQKYASIEMLHELCTEMEEKMAPVINRDYKLSNSIPEIVEMASGNSVINEEVLREGIVIRPYEEKTDFSFYKKLVKGRVSFKSINREFLLKHEE